MKDEIIALELLKIQYKPETNIDKHLLYEDYEYYIEQLENKYLNTKISKIKKIFKENESISGSWCDLKGINMLTKIQRIINNEEED